MITALILIPLLAGIVAALDNTHGAQLAKRIAAAASLVATLISGAMYFASFHQAGFQYVEKIDWIKSLGIQYAVGADGLSLPFIVLTALLTFCSVLAQWDEERSSFFALLLALQAIVTGVFGALDLVLFIFLFEVSLIPMFFLIGKFGYDNRRYAAIKFILYSLTGGVLALVSILALAYYTSKSAGIPLTFDYEILRQHLPVIQALPGIAFIFWGLMLGFLIKLPAFPVHTWLPWAHTEAPTAGSIMLAGVLLKMGGYGMIRFVVGLMPQQMHTYQMVLGVIATIGIVYGAYCAMAQKDLKKMVAYSSVNHMGYVLLGIVSMTAMGLHGAMFQMVAHGLITGLMFMTVGFLSHRTHTREIARMTGMYHAMPILGAIMWAAFLGGLGLPGMAGFIGEFTALQGAFQNPNTFCFGWLGLLGIIITAAFILLAIQRVLLGRSPFVHDAAHGHDDAHDTHTDTHAGTHTDTHTAQTLKTNDQISGQPASFHLHDLLPIEIAAAAPLLVLAIVLGLYPALLTPLIDSAIQPLLESARTLVMR